MRRCEGLLGGPRARRRTAETAPVQARASPGPDRCDIGALSGCPSGARTLETAETPKNGASRAASRDNTEVRLQKRLVDLQVPPKGHAPGAGADAELRAQAQPNDTAALCAASAGNAAAA